MSSHELSALLSEAYPHRAGNFLRCEVISHLPIDDLMAASSTCQAMRNSVHDMIKGSQIHLPSEYHILTKRIALFEWSMNIGYHLQPDRDEDDRDIEFHKSDTWVRRIGSFTRACLAGNLEMLQHLIEVKKCPRNMDYAIMFAAYGGHIDCLDWLCDMSDMKSMPRKCLKAASYAGHVEVLNWLRAKFNGDRVFPVGDVNDIGYHASLGGHRSMIQWLRDSGCRLSEDCCRGAAMGGHLELLQWLIEIKCPVPVAASYYAGIGGSKAMLAWLRDAGYAWDEETFCGAAQGGHIETLQWLLDNECPTPEDLSDVSCSAASGGHIPMINWLLDRGFPCNEETCKTAASLGHLSTLRFLRSRGCPWDSDTTRAAAGGRVNTLRWAIENGCPVTPVATLFAASRGHLEVLKMLVEEFHCDINVSECIRVVDSSDRHKHVQAWLRSREGK